MYRIILDAMGGDNAPGAIIEGAMLALAEYPDLEIIFVGREKVIAEHLEGHTYDKERVFIVHAEEIIEMAEAPVAAVRAKKDSSLVVGMNLVAEGKGDAFVTAGSTGATVAGGRSSFAGRKMYNGRRSRQLSLRRRVLRCSSIAARTWIADPSICCNSA